MKGLRWFGRWTPHPITTYPRMSPDEARVASAWGHTQQTWLALTPQQRTKAREDVTKAPRYVG